jgi:hypothetical protein
MWSGIGCVEISRGWLMRPLATAFLNNADHDVGFEAAAVDDLRDLPGQIVLSRIDQPHRHRIGRPRT